MLYVVKIIVSALLILLISELVKKTGFWGALLASLPIVSIISIIWIYVETKDISRIRDFSYDVFWLVLPSLGFFILLPFCLQKVNFTVSMIISSFGTILLYATFLWMLPKLGIKIL